MRTYALVCCLRLAIIAVGIIGVFILFLGNELLLVARSVRVDAFKNFPNCDGVWRVNLPIDALPYRLSEALWVRLATVTDDIENTAALSTLTSATVPDTTTSTFKLLSMSCPTIHGQSMRTSLAC